MAAYGLLTWLLTQPETSSSFLKSMGFLGGLVCFASGCVVGHSVAKERVPFQDIRVGNFKLVQFPNRSTLRLFNKFEIRKIN